jgi:hypothetical protein
VLKCLFYRGAVKRGADVAYWLGFCSDGKRNIHLCIKPEISALWKYPLLLGITCGVSIFIFGLAVSFILILWQIS